MRILVTGAAGFIGMHITLRLLRQDNEITGVDNLNDFYNPRLKHARLRVIQANDPHSKFEFQQVNIADPTALSKVFQGRYFDVVVHLAAQAGVRYSLDNPSAYLESNLSGFLNLLECMRHQVNPKLGSGQPLKHFLYASSSSVYGLESAVPFMETMPADKPLSLYAATKRSNELMAHSYAHLIGIPSTGLRFFTVYGPWGRPDMAYFKFSKAILEGSPITLFNYGNMKRDFTYIDDVVEATLRLISIPPTANIETSKGIKNSVFPSLNRVVNIGSNGPVNLIDLISTIEGILGIKALIKFDKMQDGDVYETYANTDMLKSITDFEPKTSLQFGLSNFIFWLKSYLKYH